MAEPGPSPTWGLTFLAVTVIVHAGLGTALPTMIAFFCNVAAQHTGGVHMTLRRQATASPGVTGIRTVVSHERLRSLLPTRLGARV
jgi:ABC-type multidrug transport system permease subunit